MENKYIDLCVILPVHLGTERHWALAAILCKEKQTIVIYLDALMDCSQETKRVLLAAAAYISRKA